MKKLFCRDAVTPWEVCSEGIALYGKEFADIDTTKRCSQHVVEENFVVREDRVPAVDMLLDSVGDVIPFDRTYSVNNVGFVAETLVDCSVLPPNDGVD